MIQLPLGIDKEAWEGFCEMRKAYRRPFTERAQRMILTELAKIEAAGHCPNAALRQSTLHGWLDVWPAKDKQIEKRAGSVGETQALFAEWEKARAEAVKSKPPERLLRMVGKA